MRYTHLLDGTNQCGIVHVGGNLSVRQSKKGYFIYASPLIPVSLPVVIGVLVAGTMPLNATK